MGFVNDYLTEEEKAEFKERAIPYPAHLWWANGILGYHPYEKVSCTLDREEKIYLFDCWRNHNDDEPDDYHFALVWDSVLKNSIVAIDLKRKMQYDLVGNMPSEIHWSMVNIHIPKENMLEKETLINILKEALKEYKLDGDPNYLEKRIVKFNF